MRDIPDVSLFASKGIWGHYYGICYSDRRNGGSSCSGAPSTWAGAGGTSFASPIMAGIQALVNQHLGLSKVGIRPMCITNWLPERTVRPFSTPLPSAITWSTAPVR
jgi:hypothetical protein